MKKSTIEKIINKKFDEFLLSIKDETVRDLVSKNTLITGGCITSMFLKDTVNDFDLYFTNKETVKSVAKYYLDIFNKNNNTNGKLLDGSDNKWKHIEGVKNLEKDRIKIFFESAGVAKEKDLPDGGHELNEEGLENYKDDGEPFRPIYMSSNAITLSSQMQLIIRFYGDPKQIHDNYDFVHCTNYWTSKDRKVVTNLRAMEAILSKELFYIGSKYPLASIIRLRKFIKRGWNINAGQIVKISFQISKLDLSDVSVLEDQLVGVDLAYFSLLIDAMNNCKDNNIGYEYICTIIDKIFD